jgi:hypothetical protein
MGEAKRRRGTGPVPGGGFYLAGPFSYELGYYRLDDIFAGVLATMSGEARPSAQARAILRATEELARRMQDPRLPTMLCMSCDHEFKQGDRPTEIAVALSWANPDHPPIVSPICAVCAAADQETKTAKVKAYWEKLSLGVSFDGPGRA